MKAQIKKKECKHNWQMTGGNLHMMNYCCRECGITKSECSHKWHIIALPPPPQGVYGSWQEAAAICEYCLEKRHV